ncbi:MAG: ImmA/IrrE family metallo-endopeptidase [Chloroflexus sp.]|uniref:ImmA/IrrE family metallo-endopeptidase n=1 Tax=Chloroflexus sp. TaxID=1904827 RepID=UPI00309F5982
MTRVAVRPELLRWACERSGRAPDDLALRFRGLPRWLAGQEQPTFKQLEAFAKATHTPFGYFFLPEPPQERLPITDLRTFAGRPPRPSADLLETIYAMQQRSRWLSDERREEGAEPLRFVGAARLDDDPVAIGQEMRRAVGLDERWAAAVSSWQAAVGELRRRIEDIGVLAVINGVVGNNTHRRLDVKEFRGFALVDPYAPLIFVNGADAKSAQMFTLAHELAHLWLGPAGEGVSGFEGIFPGEDRVERFCDRAAAEFLVPAREFDAQWQHVKRAEDRFERLARHFKVSPIVAARRAVDLRLISREDFLHFYQEYTSREYQHTKATGGDFYSNQHSRVGERFARRVIYAALEGRITFKEAYELTGLSSGAFQRYARRLGIALP